MHTFVRSSVVSFAALACGAFASAAGQSIEVTIVPKATYLHAAVGDAATDTIPIALAQLGDVTGKSLHLVSLGAMDNGPQSDVVNSTIAVFSAGTVLLPKASAQRVPGALEAGADFVSSPTYFGGETTDIAEDFRVTGAEQADVVVAVPTGATHLFVANHDSLYQDNSDPNGDHRVRITVVGTWAHVGPALAGSAGLPQLDGSGLMLGNDPWTLTLSSARSNASSWLVLGSGALPAPFKGGVLVPLPDVVLGPLPTGPTGGYELATTWPSGVPSGVSLWTQVWIQDPAGPLGFASTNGLRATAP